jgi:hypothetical protein
LFSSFQKETRLAGYEAVAGLAFRFLVRSWPSGRFKDFDPVMQELHPPKRGGSTPVWKEKS